MSPDGSYMGLVPGQSNLPHGDLPTSAPSPPQAAGSTRITPGQRQLVDDMASIGLRWGTDQQLINAGESTCAEIRNGQSRARSIQVVYRALKRVTLDQATAAVDFAIKDLCPDAPAR
ncbi:hypothetical protein BST20_01655 [Mycobacterium branderi]|nr:hypothetical protein BST20_01655 [Mycobacterium branderi]